jgi:hypothetical protein
LKRGCGSRGVLTPIHRNFYFLPFKTLFRMALISFLVSGVSGPLAMASSIKVDRVWY